ncbi:MAG: hypothetical protein O3C51_14040 [Planctomycetota bacterium]|nr:hypothetical protein [Planctomycetota bacterium]MDA1222884.1 hypothetical protein [Planctomycetota bacterium]
MIELCLTLCLAFQDPEPRPQEAPPAPAAPAYEEWDDKTAKEAVKDFEKKMKPKSASLRDKLAAVEGLAQGRNAKLVAPLAKTCLTEKALTVRKAAADALAHQPEKEAKRAVLTLLGDAQLRDVPQVCASLLLALGTLGYEAGRDWKHLEGLFDRDYAAERVPLQQAMLKLIQGCGELEALDLLVDNLGEPIPADPDDPANPPASYWEARWKAWSVWREDVKATLLSLTGQRFSTAEEAKIWIKKNGAELRRRNK